MATVKDRVRSILRASPVPLHRTAIVDAVRVAGQVVPDSLEWRRVEKHVDVLLSQMSSGDKPELRRVATGTYESLHA